MNWELYRLMGTTYSWRVLVVVVGVVCLLDELGVV
jgi:hypothetical protein